MTAFAERQLLLRRPIDIRPVSGGDINEAFVLGDDQQQYFIKLNCSSNHSAILASEYEALKRLRDHGIVVPAPINCTHTESLSILAMEYIPGHNSWNTSSERNFTTQMSKLHSIKNENFGYGSHNCIGSLPQINDWYDNFSEYYWQSRLRPQLQMAYKQKYLESPEHFVYLEAKLKTFPYEGAVLIHGDLWAGNRLIAKDNMVYLIDPSLSFGQREMDLAMMHLFGGYTNRIFELYNDKMPLQKDWEKRLPMFQLYYLLVHLNIFGRSYLHRVQKILRYYR